MRELQHNNYLEEIIPKIGKDKLGPATVIARDMIQHGIYDEDLETLTNPVFIVRPDGIFFVIEPKPNGDYCYDDSNQGTSIDDYINKLAAKIQEISLDVDIIPYDRVTHDYLKSRLTVESRTITVSEFQGRYHGDGTSWMSGKEIDIIILRYTTGR